jgi:hypothetical protein
MTLVSVRVPSELVSDLELVAQRRNEPKTALVRMALEEPEETSLVNVSGSLTLTAPLVEKSEAMASFVREYEAATAPFVRQIAKLTETLRRVGELIAESPYVRAKKTKARLVAFLLELLVRARRSLVADVPAGGVAALGCSPLTKVPTLRTGPRVSQLERSPRESRALLALTPKVGEKKRGRPVEPPSPNRSEPLSNYL